MFNYDMFKDTVISDMAEYGLCYDSNYGSKRDFDEMVAVGKIKIGHKEYIRDKFVKEEYKDKIIPYEKYVKTLNLIDDSFDSFFKNL